MIIGMTATGAASPGPVTATDVQYTVDDALRALRPATARDWHVRASDLDWDCWETLEHISDCLFAYATQLATNPPPDKGYVPFALQQRRPGGPDNTIFADPVAGNTGLLQVFEATGGLLVAMVRTASPDVRAHHVFGASDPEGFAAMGVVEMLLHVHDIAAGLDVEWLPAEDLCDRVLGRLFPDAPTDTDRWPTLLWATGRGSLPGRPRLTSWRWDGTVRANKSDAPN
jgi:hypothetical protein